MLYNLIFTGLASFLTYDFCMTEYDYLGKVGSGSMAICAALIMQIIFWTISDIKKSKDETRWQNKRRKAIEPSFHVEKDDLNVKEEYSFLFNKN